MLKFHGQSWNYSFKGKITFLRKRLIWKQLGSFRILLEKKDWFKNWFGSFVLKENKVLIEIFWSENELESFYLFFLPKSAFHRRKDPDLFQWRLAPTSRTEISVLHSGIRSIHLKSNIFLNLKVLTEINECLLVYTTVYRFSKEWADFFNEKRNES